MSWTPERVARLKKLAPTGLSASQIAKDLGGITRNAVIGKMLRMGFERPHTPTPPSRCAHKLKAPKAAATKRVGQVLELKRQHRAGLDEPKIKSAPLPPETDAPGSATVLTLEGHMCKWPIGDPSADSFTFCGKRKRASGGSYCEDHAVRAFAPTPPIRKARRA